MCTGGVIVVIFRYMEGSRKDRKFNQIERKRVATINQAIEKKYDDLVYFTNEKGEVIAAGSSEKKGGELWIRHLGSMGEIPYLGLQVLKVFAEDAKKNNLIIKLYALNDSIPYYERLGFKRDSAFSSTMCIDPQKLLEHPDFFPEE